MDFYLAPTQPISEQTHRTLKERALRFAKAWNQEASLRQIGIPAGDGRPQDIQCLDYVLYEGLYPKFAADFDDFVRLGSAVLGGVLVRTLGFEWCELHITGTRTIGLFNPHNTVRVPINEMVAHKLSSTVHLDTFEYLFFDILLSASFWHDGCHPLLDCDLMTTDEPSTFRDLYGYDIPPDVKQAIELLNHMNEELWIRGIGLEAYIFTAEQKWDELRNAIHSVSHLYSERYGDEWKVRAEKECANTPTWH